MSLYQKIVSLAAVTLLVVLMFLLGLRMGEELLFLKTGPGRWIFPVVGILGVIGSTLLISQLLYISKPGAGRTTNEEIRNLVSWVSFSLIGTAILLGATARLFA